MRVFLIQAATYFPETEKCFPVGLLQLAAYLRDRAGHEVGVFDMQPDVRSPEPVLRALQAFRPEVVGISALSTDARVLHAVAAAVKQARPDLPIMAGGAHPTTYPENTLSPGQVDYVIAGEGELGAAALLRYLAGEITRDDVPNLVVRDDGRLVRNAPAPWIENLDALPFAAYDLLDLEPFYRIPRTGVIWARRRYAAVATSRGCPYHCAYCHQILGKKYRPRSPAHVVTELRQLVERHRIGEIVFVDDMFNLQRERVQELCRLMCEAGLDLKLAFPIGLRGDIMDEETVRALVGAGMFRCMYAVETASPRLQSLIGKNLAIDKVMDIIEVTNRYGVLTHGTFMLGFPSETEAEARATVDLACRSKLATAAFFRVIPFGDTPLVELARQYGAKLPADFECYEFHKSKINISTMTDAVLDRIKKRAYLRFYLNPRRIGRILFRLPRWTSNLPRLVAMWVRKSFFW
jgi:radical SAM superfamily enzyme YgiQ (UPF0313 family)